MTEEDLFDRWIDGYWDEGEGEGPCTKTAWAAWQAGYHARDDDIAEYEKAVDLLIKDRDYFVKELDKLRRKCGDNTS